MLNVVRIALSGCSKQAINVKINGDIVRRWAGHSKWANIKHQKSANDIERNKLFTRLTRMIKVAIMEGKDADPETNSRLASVVGQCKRVNMPSSNITNAIKAAASGKSDEKITVLQIRGPGRCAMLVEIGTNNTAVVKNSIASLMKKHACRYDNVNNEFIEKGVIIASPLANSANPLEDATEHAIECSVEDVNYDEESKKLRFECSASSTWKAKKGLEVMGYVVDSAVVEQLPTTQAELSDDQVEVIQKFVAKLEAMPEVMQITDNIA